MIGNIVEDDNSLLEVQIQWLVNEIPSIMIMEFMQLKNTKYKLYWYLIHNQDYKYGLIGTDYDIFRKHRKKIIKYRNSLRICAPYLKKDQKYNKENHEKLIRLFTHEEESKMNFNSLSIDKFRDYLLTP